MERSTRQEENIFVDTIISPSYTSAIAQVVQLPSPSGMENNMIIFEYDKHDPQNLEQIIKNVASTQAGDFDVCILGSSSRTFKSDGEMHIWIRDICKDNANLMILLCYIILGHPDWKQETIKIFKISRKDEKENDFKAMNNLVKSGRSPISEKNINIIDVDGEYKFNVVVNENSTEAGLVLMAFREELLKREGAKFFEGFDKLGDILFIDSHQEILIQ